MLNNITQIPAPRVAVVDERTGLMTVQWFRYFNNINTIVGGGTGVTPPASGGTGANTAPTNGQILIGNNTGTYTVAFLTVGAGLFRTNGSGSLTVGISNTGVTAASYGSASSVASFTVNAQGQLTAAANTPIAISRTQVSGLGTMSTQNANAVAITGGTIAGLSAPIAVASGGSGAITLTGYVKGNGTSAMTASATIPNTDITGLGTMSTQNASTVAITGGTIAGTDLNTQANSNSVLIWMGL